jgi:hypothetical protein
VNAADAADAHQSVDLELWIAGIDDSAIKGFAVCLILVLYFRLSIRSSKPFLDTVV